MESEWQVISQFAIAGTDRLFQKILTCATHRLDNVPAMLIRSLIERRSSMVDGVGHMGYHADVCVTRFRESKQ